MARLTSFLTLYKYKYDYILEKFVEKNYIWQMRIISSYNSNGVGVILLTNCVTKQLHEFPHIMWHKINL